jgi:hypothetical protein
VEQGPKQINFRLNDTTKDLIGRLCEYEGHSVKSAVVRNAVTVAQLAWCAYGRKLVLRNGNGDESVFAIPDPETTRDNCWTLQVRTSSETAFLRDMDSLNKSDFGVTDTEIIRRSLTLYEALLSRAAAGWECGYVNSSGQFTLLPVLTLIRRPERPSPLRDPSRAIRRFNTRPTEKTKS